MHEPEAVTAPTPERPPLDVEALKRLRALAGTTGVSAVAMTLPELDAILAALTELEGLRAALARCWTLMDRSEGRVAEELYDILLPFEDALVAREAEEASGG